MPFYSEAQRRLQDQFESRTLADRLEGTMVGDEVNEILKGFVESRDFFFQATVNAGGTPPQSLRRASQPKVAFDRLGAALS